MSAHSLHLFVLGCFQLFSGCFHGHSKAGLCLLQQDARCNAERRPSAPDWEVAAFQNARQSRGQEESP